VEIFYVLHGFIKTKIKMNFNFSRQQQNIFMMIGIVAAAIIVLFVFIFMPKEAQMKKLRQELKSVEISLADIETIVGKKENLGSGILKLRQEKDALESRFMRHENLNSLLQTLSEQARGCGLEVISIQPSEFVLFYGTKGSLLKMDNLECNKVSIEMSVTGSFKPIIDYMESLERKDSPKLFIKKFSVEKQQQARLNAYIIVDGFALIPKKSG